MNINKIKKYIKSHKIISTIVILVIIFGIYGIYKKSHSTPTSQYVLGTVQKGTLISTVTGTGQVSASQQVDLKPKNGGQVVYVGVKSGQEVKAGTVLVRIDAKDAVSAVNDAKTSLESAQLALEKLRISTQNNLSSSIEANQTAKDNLVKSYNDAFSAVADGFANFSPILNGLNNLLNSENNYLATNVINTYSDRRVDYKQSAVNSYYEAKNNLDLTTIDYKNTTRQSSTSIQEDLLNQTVKTAQLVSDAVKDAKTLVDYIDQQSSSTNKPPTIQSDKTTLTTYLSQANSNYTSILGAKNNIELNKKAIADTERDISENQIDQGGGAALDIQTAELTVQQRQNALNNAYNKLADYSIKAPFGGVVGAVNVKVGDTNSTADAVASMITRQKIATISLNEVDVAKISLSQKATLTFDALPDLSISGEVVEIDNIGTVDQGVVTYNIKINFDTQDDRVKPGMSVSAAIITDSRTDVLMVPSGAIKNSGGQTTVQVVDNPPAGSVSSAGAVSLSSSPRSVTVTTGSSNDTDTEIVSGLNEGAVIVVRTVNSGGTASNTTTSNNQTRTIFGGGGGGGAGGARNFGR